MDALQVGRSSFGLGGLAPTHSWDHVIETRLRRDDSVPEVKAAICASLRYEGYLGVTDCPICLLGRREPAGSACRDAQEDVR